MFFHKLFSRAAQESWFLNSPMVQIRSLLVLVGLVETPPTARTRTSEVKAG